MSTPVLLLTLAACAGPADTDTSSPADDSADSQDTEDTGVPPEGLAGADATFVGSPSDAAGCAVTGPGDLDADGYDDVVVAAYYGGRVCVFPGPIAAGRQTLDAAPACLTGEGAYDFAGYTLAPAGDLNGDGNADLLVGAIGNGDMGANAGKAYLVLGPIPAGSSSLADSWAAWVGEAGNDYAGIGLAAGGDLTGDGVDDLVVGASGSDAAGAGGGTAYVLPGPFLAGTGELGDAPVTFLGLPTASKVRYHGSMGAGDGLGDAIGAVGDVDGDGIADLVLGAGGDATLGSNTGKAALFYGPLPLGEHEVSAADLILRGEAASDYAGSPVTAAGDLDDDGYRDFLVSADGAANGTAYLVSGPPGAGDRSLGEAATRFAGEVSDDQAGYAIAAPGDVDGDGAADLFFGAPGSDRAGVDAGAVYLYAGPFGAGVHTLADAAWVEAGEHLSDRAGQAVSTAGDVDGDGGADLLVGAIYNDEGGAFAGKAYLLRGP